MSRKIPKAAAVKQAQQGVEQARLVYKQVQAQAERHLAAATRELERVVGRHAVRAIHNDPQRTAAQVVALLPELTPAELRRVETWWRAANPEWLPAEVQASLKAAFTRQPPRDLEDLWPHVLKQAQAGLLLRRSILDLRRDFGLSQKHAQIIQERLVASGLFERGENGALKPAGAQE